MQQNYQALADTPIEKFTSYFLLPFSYNQDIINQNKNWEKKIFSIPLGADYIAAWEYQQNYSEYIYFHEYVREFLYPQSKTKLHDSIDRYEYRLKENLTVRLQHKATTAKTNNSKIDNTTLVALINSICLHIFPSEIGVLSIETSWDSSCEILSNEKESGITTKNQTGFNGADLLYFNNMFRRIYVSYFENDQSDGFFAQVNNEEYPMTISILSAEKTIYEQSYGNISKNTHLIPNQDETYTPVITSFASNLLNDFFNTSATSAYKPILDDRMLVYSYAAFPASLGDTVDGEARDIFFSQYLYVDNPSSSYRYSKDFTQEIMADTTYVRWKHLNTNIGFSRFSGAFLYFGHADYLYRPFATMYYQMFLLIVYYRCCLIRFANEASLIAKEFPKNDKEHRHHSSEFVKKLRQLHTRFLKFMNIHWFKEVTHQDQGIEIFRLMRKAFDLDEMYGEVKEEIERADELAQLIRQEQMEAFGKRMTVLGIVISIMATLPVIINYSLVKILVVLLVTIIVILGAMALFNPKVKKVIWSSINKLFGCF
jgi:hypothetical protein